MNLWKDLRVTMSVLVLNIISIVFTFFPDFGNLYYLLTLNDTSNESILTCDIGKTLGNDLNLLNEIYGKNDNEFIEKSDLQEKFK